MSSSDEEKTRDSVTMNTNIEPSDHKTEISDNDTSPDNSEATKKDEKTSEEIESMNREFVLAAKEGRLSDITQMWSDHKHIIDINTADGENYSAIHRASLAGNLEMVMFLMSASANIHLKAKFGSTPILLASWKGHLEVARRLLMAGADPDVPNNGGRTAITWAHRNDNTALVQILISHILANNKSSDNDGKCLSNSIDSAIKEGGKFNDLVKLIVSSCPNSADAFVKIAAEHNNYPMVEFLVTKGADPDFVDDSDRKTPIMICAENGAFKSVDFLITAGAQIGNQDVEGMDALMHASSEGKLASVATLLERGAKWDGIKNNNGQSAKDLARINKHQTVADLLRLFEFSNNGAQPQYKPILVACASTGHQTICQMILDRGMPVDATNDEDKTALMSSAEAGESNIVRMFLERGADPCIVSKVGLTASQYAMKEGHHSIAAKILNTRVKDTRIVHTAVVQVNNLADYLGSEHFNEEDFNDAHDQLYEPGPSPLLQISNRSIEETNENSANEIDNNETTASDDDDDDDDVINEDGSRSTPSMIETIMRRGSEKEREKCLEVAVIAEEKKHPDEKPDKIEQKVIEKLRGTLVHPELASSVRFVKSLFPMGTATFVLTLGILFITSVILGVTSYCVDIYTDITFTLSMFNMDITNTTITDAPGFAFLGTLSNINQTILAVEDAQQFFIAGIVSAVHIGISFLMSMIFFLCVEWGRFSKESLLRIPIPPVTKVVAFYYELQKLKLFREKRGPKRDRAIKKMTKTMEDYADWINLSLMLEASFESGV